jgi:hypothetical protein
MPFSLAYEEASRKSHSVPHKRLQHLRSQSKAQGQTLQSSDHASRRYSGIIKAKMDYNGSFAFFFLSFAQPKGIMVCRREGTPALIRAPVNKWASREVKPTLRRQWRINGNLLGQTPVFDCM